MDIRAKQTEALVRLLHPPAGDDDDPAAASSAYYRVLVLDAFTKDVVAPLLRVGDLRRHGVSLHLQLRAPRDPIPDAPAVYFVSGRDDNNETDSPSSSQPSVVDVIAADAARGLYSKMHLNFCGGLARGGLERLAAAVVAADASGQAAAAAAAAANGSGAPSSVPAPPAPPSALSRIGRVVDQHLAFVALEPGLFTLRQRRCYVALHDPAAPAAAVERAVAAVAEGLFSALATLGVVPLIRCPKGGPAQAVAVALDARLREAARAGAVGGAAGGIGGGVAAAAALAASSAAAASPASSRPLLVIFDRSVDMAACLQHGWTYKPLVADVLGLELNRVALPRGGGGGGGGGGGDNGSAAGAAAAKTTVEVGPGDFFWEANGSSPFPAVAEEVDAQLKKYKAAVEEVNRNAAAGGGGNGGNAAAQVAALQGSNSSTSTASLAAAVASLPELAERKRTLDRHTNIATQLLHAIKARGLDAWHAAEEDVVSGLGGSGGIGAAAGAAGANLGAVVGGGVAAVASRVGVGASGPASAEEQQQQQQRRSETALERLLRGEKGSPADRTRAALVWAAAASPLPTDEEFQRVEAALRDGGGDCGAFAYIRRLRRLNLAGNAAAAAAPAASSSSSSAAGGVLSWADKALGASVASLARGVRGLLAPGERPSPIVAALEGLAAPPPPSSQQPSGALSSISDPSAAAATAAAELDASFATYDPRLPAGAPVRRGPGAFADVVAFVVGGGSYLEREAVHRWASRGVSSSSSGSSGGRRRVVYGATELLSGEEFAAQLGELARRSGLA